MICSKSLDLVHYEIFPVKVGKGGKNQMHTCTTLCYIHNLQTFLKLYSCMGIRYAKLFEAAKSMFKS